MVDAKKYRERGTKVVTTEKTGETFTVRRMSPIRLVEVFANEGITLEPGVEPTLDTMAIFKIASQILPDCVDEVAPRGEGDDGHLELDELDIDDAVELFMAAIELSGVKDKELKAAADFRGEPDSSAGSPDGEGVPRPGRPDDDSGAPDQRVPSQR